MQLQCLVGKDLQCPLHGDRVDRLEIAPEGVSFLLVEFLSSVKIMLLLLMMVTVVS